MKDRAIASRRRLAVALLVVGLVAGGSAALLWSATRSALGDVPMSTSPASSTLPVAPVAPAPSPGSTTPTAAPLQDIAGTPVHVTVLQEGARLIDADVNRIQLDEDGWLSPDQGLAGWYGPPQWETVPGNLSAYRGIIVGHNVTGYGTKDVFYDLGQVRAGDSVVVTYALQAGGYATAGFAATQDAQSAPKQDVVEQAATTYRWVWQVDAPERSLALFSCDLDAPHIDGHSVDNWIVTAVRVS
ncbi:class F sortase [Microbacterium sp. NPDC056052]|uniref:class F sortase n=1 Tax=Microbacterium sp. NPDC056052 TaxID=3345695 RepID=UPI0035E2807B